MVTGDSVLLAIVGLLVRALIELDTRDRRVCFRKGGSAVCSGSSDATTDLAVGDAEHLGELGLRDPAGLVGFEDCRVDGVIASVTRGEFGHPGLFAEYGIAGCPLRFGLSRALCNFRCRGPHERDRLALCKNSGSAL